MRLSIATACHKINSCVPGLDQTLSISLFFLMGQNNAPIAASIAMIVPFAVVPLVSLLTKPPRKDVLEKAFRNIV